MNQIYSSFIILFLFFLFSCSEKTKNNLEIYLLDDRIDSNVGIPFSSLKSDYFEHLASSKEDLKYASFDTINNKIIYGGEFNLPLYKFHKTPFINDSEIIRIDTLNSKIILTESGVEKISSLKPDMVNGIQFVICNNKIPVFNGYFWSKHSSFKGSWYCIEFDHLDKKTNSFKFYKSYGMNSFEDSKVQFNKYGALLKSINHKLN